MLVSGRLEDRRHREDVSPPREPQRTKVERKEASNPEEPDGPGKRWMLDFQAGDDSAFDRIVLEYQRSVQHFLYRYLHDRHRTEDLTQEVFIRVYRSRRRYTPSAGFRTWLFTIATRLALNEIRGIRRRRRVFSEREEGSSQEGGEIWEAAPERREPGPLERLEHEELDEVIARLIEELPENQRAAVLLSRLEELPYRDIAAALGVTVTAVKSLLLRARETLRLRLERYLTGRPLHLKAADRPSRSRKSP
jgi:RNA polymerase sigma-70 factor (ECF subfamily)